MVSIASSSKQTNYTIVTGTWPFYTTVPWSLENSPFPAGTIISYTDPNTNETLLFYVRKTYTYDPNKPPGPATRDWEMTTLSPLRNTVEWLQEYTYNYGDVVTYNGLYYICQSPTRASNLYDSQRPTSGSNIWHQVRDYDPEKNYSGTSYYLPIKYGHGSSGRISAVFYEGAIYRQIRSVPAGNLPTNTYYWKKLETPLDYYRNPVPHIE